MMVHRYSIEHVINKYRTKSKDICVWYCFLAIIPIPLESLFISLINGATFLANMHLGEER